MSDNKAIILVLVLMLIAVSVILIIEIVKNYSLEEKLKIATKKYDELKIKNGIERTKYSDDILKYIRDFTTQATVLKYKSFLSKHELEKITRMNLEKLIDEVARSVHSTIDVSKINFDETLFTKEFLDEYIISIVINNIKEMFDRSVEDL